jgi:Cu/Ag efflux protein CusF
MKQKRSIAPIAALMVMALGTALHAAEPSHQHHEATQPAGQVHQGRGIIEALDPVKGVVTIEHDAIASLNWPKMVMDFKVSPPSLLKGLKEGARVVFDLVQTGKEVTLTRIGVE